MSYAVEAYDGELKDLRRFIRESDHESRLMEIELCKTNRALWLARALRAHTEKLFYFNLGMNTISEKWAWAERKCIDKCIEKAKEFK